MSKVLCLIHANCQGVELETLLKASRSFSETFRIERYTNYTKESIPDESLAECGLFLYQHIGPQWGELSSAALLSKLPPLAASLQVPNMLFTAYWPFWTARGPMGEFNDKLLNQLIDQGLPKEAVIRQYASQKALKPADIAASYERSIAIERTKEENALVKTVDFVLERWKEKPMFHTINHPCAELLIHAAQKILEGIGMPRLSKRELEGLNSKGLFPSYADFDLPIHPYVAAFHSLKFIGLESRFSFFGQSVSFEEYVSLYIDCRLQGREKDFPACLQEGELMTGT